MSVNKCKYMPINSFIICILLYFIDSNTKTHHLLESAVELMTGISNGEKKLEEGLQSDVLTQLQSARATWNSIMSSYRTANLWIM